MIGLIGAMAVEVEQLMDKLVGKETRKIGMDTFVYGKLFEQEAVLAVCGPGKVNAALCAQNMITAFHPDWILNLGVAGAGDETVTIGDMVIASAAVQHDMDTSPIGDPVGFVSKVALIEFPCDEALRASLMTAAASVPGLHTEQGIIATGDQFICRSEDRIRIHDLFHAKAVEMEGAAIAHACYMNGTPCGILRSISDNANGSSVMDYPTFTKLAASHSMAVVEKLLQTMR